MAANKRKFTVKFDWSVVAELDALLKANPQLPFKSTAEACQHAVAFFTDDLRKRLGMARLDPDNPPPLEEMLTFIEHVYKERRAKQPAPPAPKKGKS